MPRPIALALAMLLAFAASAVVCGTAHAADRLGIVVLHDKNGASDKQLNELVRVLRNVGFAVSRPELPWSRKRGFDATYEQALVEIGMAAEELRLAGCTQIALVGHGLGANAALGFAASRGGVFAIAALAPSHDPERHREVFLPDVRKARSLITSVGGNARSQFTDINLDKDYDLSTTAEVYLSFNDPDGAAVMPHSAEALKTPIPLLWVVGLRDPLCHLGRSYVYAKAPSHPESSYEEIQADHMGVPREAARMVAEWLRGLSLQGAAN